MARTTLGAVAGTVGDGGGAVATSEALASDARDAAEPDAAEPDPGGRGLGPHAASTMSPTRHTTAERRLGSIWGGYCGLGPDGSNVVVAGHDAHAIG